MINIDTVTTGEGGAFPLQVHFRAFKDEVEEVCAWASNTFVKNFVLLEIATRIKAGGCVDNRKAWLEKWMKNGIHSRFRASGEYELRGYEEDIASFLVKYKKDKENYENN